VALGPATSRLGSCPDHLLIDRFPAVIGQEHSARRAQREWCFAQEGRSPGRDGGTPQDQNVGPPRRYEVVLESFYFLVR
jgi:hypothetical protein